MKKVFLTAALVLTAISGSAVAAPLTACPDPTSFPGTILLSALITSGGCQQSDKQYTSFTNVGLPFTGLPSDWKVSFTENPADFHNVTMAPGTKLTGLGDWSVAYAIAVDTVLFPTKFISQVQVDSTLSGSVTATLTKSVYTAKGGTLIGTVTSVDSVPGLLTIHQQSIYVIENIHLAAATGLASFTDSYVQSTPGVVPEPATYAMMGLGLAALGLISRRKKT